jgi:hypothetical protein
MAYYTPRVRVVCHGAVVVVVVGEHSPPAPRPMWHPGLACACVCVSDAENVWRGGVLVTRNQPRRAASERLGRFCDTRVHT